MKVKNKLFIIWVLLTIFMLRFCEKEFKFPNNTDFTFTYSISNSSPQEGELFEVIATLENTTGNEYKINRGVHLIHIISAKEGEPATCVEPTVLLFDTIKPNEKKKFNKFIELSGKGNHKIHIYTQFEIKNPKTKEERKYTYNIESINIEIK